MKLKNIIIICMIILSTLISAVYVYSATIIDITTCKSGSTDWTCASDKTCVCTISGTCTSGYLLVYNDTINNLLCSPIINGTTSTSNISWSTCANPIGSVKVRADCNENQSLEKIISITPITTTTTTTTSTTTTTTTSTTTTTTPITSTSTTSSTTTTPPPCSLNSVSITPQCSGGSSSNCEPGETIKIDATYSGSCPSTSYIQIDAQSADNSCKIYDQGRSNCQTNSTVITGMNIQCTSSPCSTTWTIPSPIPSNCLGKTVVANGSSIRNNYPCAGGTGYSSITATGSLTFYLLLQTSTTTTSTTTTTKPPTSTTTSSTTTSSTTTSSTTTTTPIISEFSDTSFDSKSIQGGYNISVGYVKTAMDNVNILFVATNSTGSVTYHMNQVATFNSGTVYIQMICSFLAPGKYSVAWIAFLASDTNLTNPIAWSRSIEMKSIIC